MAIRDATLAPSAYGFRLAGIASRYLTADGDAGRPLLTVRRRRVEGAGPAAAGRDEAKATLVLPLVGGGRLALDRARRTATYALPGPVDGDDLAHPLLAAAASVMAGWQGWDPFHAGAYRRGDHAVAVLGAREQGKSTLLAALARTGTDVLTDDVLVLDRGVAQVGPRCIDLRPSGLDPSDGLLEGMKVEPSRSGERLRLALPAGVTPAPLGGWVALTWGERLELVPLRPSARLAHLARSHSRAGGARDDALLELARLPGWELRRPRRRELLGETCDLLLGAC